jgi:hypothetical protein
LGKFRVRSDGRQEFCFFGMSIRVEGFRWAGSYVWFMASVLAVALAENLAAMTSALVLEQRCFFFFGSVCVVSEWERKSVIILP